MSWTCPDRSRPGKPQSKTSTPKAQNAGWTGSAAPAERRPANKLTPRSVTSTPWSRCEWHAEIGTYSSALADLLEVVSGSDLKRQPAGGRPEDARFFRFVSD